MAFHHRGAAESGVMYLARAVLWHRTPKPGPGYSSFGQKHRRTATHTRLFPPPYIGIQLASFCGFSLKVLSFQSWKQLW